MTRVPCVEKLSRSVAHGKGDCAEGKRRERFPGNSKNIRFTVAICGELSNVEFSGCVCTTLDCSD